MSNSSNWQACNSMRLSLIKFEPTADSATSGWRRRRRLVAVANKFSSQQTVKGAAASGANIHRNRPKAIRSDRSQQGARATREPGPLWRRAKPTKLALHQPLLMAPVVALLLALATSPLAALPIDASATSGAPTAPEAAPSSASSESYSDQPFVFPHSHSESEPDFWARSGRKALEAALEEPTISQRAKSGVLFIGDGMSMSTITAARILQGQLMNKSGEEGQLSFEQLKNVALIKTYTIDQQVPDSAATATAILSGVKANIYTLGVNGNVPLNDTNCARIQANRVSSILKQAQEAGKSTGIITNTRITHATPAAAYAHVSYRRWEGDNFKPKSLDAACKDIARQLIEDEPGSRLNVIMGGGRRYFFGPNNTDPGPGAEPGMRLDGRNLISQWVEQRHEKDPLNYAFVNSTRDLRLVDLAQTEYLLGLFSYSHMNYEELRDTSPYGEPSLAEMVRVAIKLLSKNPNGYLLLVEGGRIDQAHHENIAGVALRETISLSWAVDTARSLVDTRDTLLAVTADHAHALTINGMAPRGSPILGLSRFREQGSQLPYTTLIYGNGPGHLSPRPDPSVGANNTSSPYYTQYAAIQQDDAVHDGSDVAIFASGPFAHLFQGSQEQSYIAHVFAFALCIGDYQESAHCRESSSSASSAGNELAFGASNRASTYLAGDGRASHPFGRSAAFGHSAASRSASASNGAQLHLTLGVVFLMLTVLANHERHSSDWRRR